MPHALTFLVTINASALSIILARIALRRSFHADPIPVLMVVFVPIFIAINPQRLIAHALVNISGRNASKITVSAT